MWMFQRFALNLRENQKPPSEHEVWSRTRRSGCPKSGQSYGNQLGRRRPRLGHTWHLNAVFIPMNGHY